MSIYTHINYNKKAHKSREMWARDQKNSKRTKLLQRAGMRNWGQSLTGDKIDENRLDISGKLADLNNYLKAF
jgi:hypothetical protein